MNFIKHMNKQTLMQIICDQAQFDLPDPLVARMKLNDLTPLLSNKQVLIISGIRRCGKSTLMRLIRKQAAESDYAINFDDDRLVPFELADFQILMEAFIELYGVQKTFYFDEIQLIPGWERFVRRLHDQNNKVFITGSNAKLLSSELGTHLTGRHIAIKLFPYSFQETFAQATPELLTTERLTSTQLALLKKNFSQFKKMGGIPEYIESGQKEYLHALYENILYKDIIVRHHLSQEKTIKELV